MKLFRITRLIPFLAVFLLLSGCGYNDLQMKEEAVSKAWADVESNLQRRADLIPNLVEVVKGYAAHEKETLDAVVSARAKATQMQISVKDLNDPQTGRSGTSNRFQRDGEVTELPFNGYFTSVVVE